MLVHPLPVHRTIVYFALQHHLRPVRGRIVLTHTRGQEHKSPVPYVWPRALPQYGSTRSVPIRTPDQEHKYPHIVPLMKNESLSPRTPGRGQIPYISHAWTRHTTPSVHRYDVYRTPGRDTESPQWSGAFRMPGLGTLQKVRICPTHIIYLDAAHYKKSSLVLHILYAWTRHSTASLHQFCVRQTLINDTSH